MCFGVSWNRTGRFPYDEAGNWLCYDKDGISETRTHNASNEIASLEYDRNGNTISLQKANCRYDAWNRLVEVNENIAYRYDGLNRRIEKAVDGIVTKSFFNEQWQELESVTAETATSYVWGLRCVDDLIYRDKNGERLYSLQDANWNVVAITNHDGVVQERYVYDAFGNVNGLASDWNRAFTGQVLDAETGLMLYRNRFYAPSLGRFVTRDPVGYEAGDENLHRYVFSAPHIFQDKLGLKKCGPHVWLYTGDYCVDDNVWDAAMGAAGESINTSPIGDLASCACGLAYMGDNINFALGPVAPAIEIADCICNIATTGSIAMTSPSQLLDSAYLTAVDCASIVAGAGIGDALLDAFIMMQQQQLSSSLDSPTFDVQMCSCQKLAQQGAAGIQQMLPSIVNALEPIGNITIMP